MPNARPSELPRTLGLIDALAIIIGITIGGGIFLVPNLVAQQLKSPGAILGVWTFAGVISFFGALAAAELGCALPATGGQYVYLREAYGPMIGFLCGWSMFTVARTAQIAWLAVTLAMYFSYFVPLSPIEAKLLGVGAIALFTAINYRGVAMSAIVQRIFTLAKLVGLFVIVASAFVWTGNPAPTSTQVMAGINGGHWFSSSGFSSFGVALIACVLAYDGWIQLSSVAGEIRNPQRNVLLALAIGSAACIGIYLLANMAYLRVLPVSEIAASERVAASVAERTMGSRGAGLVSLTILVSIIGTLNACFLTSPRVYFAQARDGLFLRKFGEIQPRYQTPGFAILAQAVWAVVLLISGSYETLLDYAMFVLWLSYGLMIAGVMILRRTQPNLPRPYRMWGYPVTPVLFMAITAWFLVNMLWTRPIPSLAGLALIATGVPVYFMWARHGRPAEDAGSVKFLPDHDTAEAD
jgi:APA family basic amino acid/polyamine antiporter